MDSAEAAASAMSSPATDSSQMLLTPDELEQCSAGQIGGQIEEGIPYIAGKMII